jgi:hypothetical protein
MMIKCCHYDQNYGVDDNLELYVFCLNLSERLLNCFGKRQTTYDTPRLKSSNEL